MYNFSAFDADTGPNGEIQYKMLIQSPAAETFSLDPLTGTLSLLQSIDYEKITEYLLVIEATDQSHNISERLSTPVTVRVIISDANDNAPVFVTPSLQDSVLYLSDSATVGFNVTHVVAIDNDSGDNGRITYAILSGNDDEHFGIDVNSGFIELLKPIFSESSRQHMQRYSNNVVTNSGKYNLMISATDNGHPTPLETRITLKIIVQGSKSNPPRFLESVYQANISENIAEGNFVVRVNAKLYHADNGKLHL